MKTNWIVALLVALNIGLLAVVFSQNQPVQAQDAAEVIRAKAFEFVDAEGNVRAQINAEPDTGEVIFRLRDADGVIRVKLGAGKDGSGLLLLNDQTEPAVHMLAKPGGTSIKLRAHDGRENVMTP